MISVWGAVIVFNLLIHFGVPNPQYQYQSPYYLHFPPIPYNQIEINGPVNSNNLPPWLLQQSNLGGLNQTNNRGLPQVGPTIGTLRVQLPNPSVPYGNQNLSPQVLNNGSLVYYLSGPWGTKAFVPINRNVDNSIVTTPANWQNTPQVTTAAGVGGFNYNGNNQQPQQFSQFDPQQQFYQQQQFNQLSQINQFAPVQQQQQQFGQQLQNNQQYLNGQPEPQQLSQVQQQDFNRDQEQPPQSETSSQNPNGPVSWSQQGGWGWDSWNPQRPLVTGAPNSGGSSAAPGRELARNQPSSTVRPTTTTASTTTANSSFAGAIDSITKLRRIVSRIRDITREELGTQQRKATSRSQRRSGTTRKTTTTTINPKQ